MNLSLYLLDTALNDPNNFTDEGGLLGDRKPTNNPNIYQPPPPSDVVSLPPSTSVTGGPQPIKGLGDFISLPFPILMPMDDLQPIANRTITRYPGSPSNWPIEAFYANVPQIFSTDEEARINELIKQKEQELHDQFYADEKNHPNYFLKKARHIGARLVHGFYDKLAELKADLVSERQNVQELLEKLLPEGAFDEIPAYTLEQQYEAAAAIHDEIDQFFKTKLAYDYLPEVKALDNLLIGVLPPPNSVIWEILGQMRLPMSFANMVKGWKLGGCVRNLTSQGNLPKWTTVRRRYWKNEAFLNKTKYTEANLKRMERGLAAKKYNKITEKWEKIELHHHLLPQRSGGLFDFKQLTPAEHAAADPYRRIGK